MSEGRALHLILSTVADREQARELAEALLREKLAACVSSVPGARSFYEWKGEFCDEEEQVLLIKTAWADASEQERIFARLAKLHPYEEPELVAFRVDAVSEGYASWALAALAPRSKEDPR
ncbi:MAG: divalent-cation tolerance protein CutA [Planctomycetota bacterium]|nr:MAG: divalent-cation tolerance protein CutA [Planctomycetota bacterium]